MNSNVYKPSLPHRGPPHMLCRIIPNLDFHTQLRLEPLSPLPSQPPGTSFLPPWALSPTAACSYIWMLSLLCLGSDSPGWDAATHTRWPCSAVPKGLRTRLLRHKREGKGKEGREGGKVNTSLHHQSIKANWANSRQYYEDRVFFSHHPPASPSCLSALPILSHS